MSYILDKPDDGLALATSGRTTVIHVAALESAAVRRAVDDLAADLAKVCDTQTQLVPDPAGARIVIGTVGVSPAIDAAIDRGDLDLTGIREPAGALRWEGYLLQAVGGTFYIVGADRRGTIFGVYDLCAAFGVSPWWWFADVPVRRRRHVTVRPDTLVCDYPSVRYRGIFINDEEELEAWAVAHTSDTTIGPQTYRRVFELVLRLRGNYIWPAMHVNAFNADPDNGRLAHEMGLVVGASHCDMLLRSNEREWGPWLAEQDVPVEYDYSIPGRNRDKLREYWRGSVEQNRDYEVSWTVGMRGIHDTDFVTTAIDNDERLSTDGRHQARVALLSQVIDDQRDILADVLGPDRARDSLQTFVPYKEVLRLYDTGLQVPDDVTIIWTDDNFGHVRRYPSEQERQRAGGHGLYYHSSYWSQPPRSYLFINSIPLAHMKNELRKAYEQGIRTLWVDNVGAIKPLEQDVEFFLRYAWEAGKETTTADVTAFTADWIDRSFTGGQGARTARIYNAFAQITNVRKIEHLSAGVFSQTGYGDEAIRRLTRLRGLYDEVNEILAALPEAERAAYFQLVGLRVHAAYLVNAQFYYADRSTLAHEQGKFPAADRYLTLSRRFDSHKRAMLRYYNTVMSDGKWDGILTPEAFPPPTTALFPAGRPALRIGAPQLGVVVWGEPTPTAGPRLTFSPHGTRHKWIEVFNAGAGELDITLASDSWITVSTVHARVAVEQRITVTVPDPVTAAGKIGRIAIHSPGEGRTLEVEVEVEQPAELPAVPARHIEADGYLSLHAADTDERHNTQRAQWVEVAHLGRDEHSLMEFRGDAAGPGHPEGDAYLGYQLHLVNGGAFLLEVHRFPSLNSTGRIRLAISVDDLPPVTVESPTTDEWRGVWTDAVLDNVEKLRLRLPYLEPGPHVLRVHAVDAYVGFSKLVIYTRTPQRTNLGPPTGPGPDLPPEPAPHDVDLASLQVVAEHFYRVDPAQLPPHPVVYVDRHYWDRDTTFTRNHAVPQQRLAAPRYLTAADGTKDILAAMPTGPAVEHDGRLALEAEWSLSGTADAYRTPSLDQPQVGWVHTQAETGGGTGLAMHVDTPGRRWDNPGDAPGLHFRLDVRTGGRYHVWLLVKYDSRDDDACYLALDGTAQPASAQFSGGDLYSFGTQQVWVWTWLADLDIPAGARTLSVLARKSRLRIDRLYLTTGDERPPADASWPAPPALSNRTYA